MNKRLLGLVGLLALLILASCEVESVEEQDSLVTTLATDGTNTSPKDKKD
ncbi:hypothetical protein U1E44_03505 [Arenibacter sp. GZD96]|nr:hypothetical protein [Arenibacter sp. GZD-96]MEA1785145.1 hypothetical protein [Arenibacter sp. GZD-96]